MRDRITHSAAGRELSQLTSEVSGSPDVQRPLRFVAQQENPRLPIQPMRLQPAPRQKPAEVALAKHEVVLLHLIDQLTTGLAQSQRGPTILNRLESGSKPLRSAIEVSRFRRIAKDLVQRHIRKLIFRHPPGDFSGKAV